MLNDIERTLLSEQEIKEITQRLGKKITEEYKGKNVLLVSILKGAVVFMADMMREIDLKCEIDFMVVSSYGSGVKTSGNVKIIKDVDIPLTGKDVIIIEDILDGFYASL